MNYSSPMRTPADFLVGQGEMAELIRSRDWSQTPLGPIERWPQSLRTTVSLCLASNFPINIIWGPEHTQIYNDGYRIVCGDVHPIALGQDYSITWASAWPAIGEPFARALAGETSFLENQRMFLTRNGYLEETFFTFSTSPIRDESGGIGGLFHPVTETTAMMLAERRTRALRDLTASLGAAADVAELAQLTIRTLAGFAFDLPFILFYEIGDEGTHYRRAGHHGIEADTGASPATIEVATSFPWPISEAIRASGIIEVEMPRLLQGTACGPYEEPPGHAFILPIGVPGVEPPPAIVIAGASPRLPRDDAYRGFYELLAAALSAALATVRAREDERRRAEALAAIDRAKTAFFSNVSHEFRTPLTLMLGPIEDALEAPDLPERQRERLDVAHRNALRLLKLVNALLDFSRIEAGRMQARFEPIDLAALTASLASNFRSACERAGLRLLVDCPPLSKPFHVDHDMWEKIVLNLLSNAFKFTLAGDIMVSLRETESGAELVVRDTGVGISADELPRVFERFHRVEGQRGRTHEGTGIGLSLVQELVALHGGSISADSVEGVGTSFHVKLRSGTGHLPPENVLGSVPLASTAVRANSFVAEALRWLPGSGEAALDQADAAVDAIEGRPRVILADDNADMRAYVRGILVEGGYDVEAVENGAAALAAARRGPMPDLVLSDVMMPELNGFELLAALRAEPSLEGLLVMLLSARAGEEARVEGLAAGADDYLLKPFSARELRARVDGAVRLARQRRDAAARERELHTALATERSRAELRETEQQLDLAMKAGRLGSWEYDLVSRSFVASEICRTSYGWAASDACGYQAMLERIHPDDREAHQQRATEAIANRSDLDIEYRISRPDGSTAWMLVRGRADYAPDGTPLRIAGVSLDITERKRAEERQRLLIDELNHRAKNMLATVQSIALQTRRTAESPAAFGEALDERIAALASAHDLLTRTSWEGATLDAVVALTLAPHAAHRVHAYGPSVRLSPNAAVTLNMAFHELATNAAKYGALSGPEGHVVVAWTVDPATNPASIEICWMERGGPRVAPPSRRGFGSRLLEQGLARELRGAVTLSFETEGLVCRMRLETTEKIGAIS